MAAATSSNKTKNKEDGGRGLIDRIFSWSIPDVMNRDLFRNLVKPIPRTFSSNVEYFKSFIYPLVEETHADLYSNMTQVPQAPFCEANKVKQFKDFKPPNNLIYTISFKKVDEKKRGEGMYKPQMGDLIAFTSKKPKCIDDLNTSRRPYTLGFIQRKNNDGDSDEFLVVSSKILEFLGERDKLFGVYLVNLTTNIRIWKALHPDPEVANMNIINNILGSDLKAGKDCSACSYNGSNEDLARFARKEIRGFGLDTSQETAVRDFVALKGCLHQNTVKLIWGPPGTGKTKTVASLLKVLLKMKCRTLTCAPTNIAVVNVVTRLMSLLKPTLEYDNYGLGDILLFGNAERMKIDDNDLYNVYLDARVSALGKCLSPISGWKGTVQSMKQLLKDPEELYKYYLLKQKEKKEAENSGKVVEFETFWEFYMKKFSELGNRLLIFLKNLCTHLPTYLLQEELLKEMIQAGESLKTLGALIGSTNASEKINRTLGNRLLIFLKNLCTHLPTCLLQEEYVKVMIRAGDSLKTLGALIGSIAITDVASKITNASEKISRAHCLRILKFLDENIDLNEWCGKISIERFCLENACLIFCTASSSAKLQVDTKKPVELLVIDEAAQLKECESTIPLQLPGLRHALLIGDEMQLPAMVQSKICENSDFGRSLFERLVMLGYEKHLLNVQYRMHPSISLFPSREFYQNKIKDGPNVKEETHEKQFLEGLIYGPCSFIDINSGREHFETGHSKRNAVEASVVADIVAQLHKKSVASKQKCRVGCISPYKDQIYAIQEKISGKYNTDENSDFSVDVRSVDGFQGAEEDIIIISTVRCNGAGTVGFLSNHQRTNVALTRARHCLWILGNSTTLINSGSIWKKLVMDLKSRGCFFNALDDKSLVQAITHALIDLKQFDKLLNIDSLLFKSAKWKVCFGDEFSRSFGRIQDSDIHKEVLSVISQLSGGWRPPHEEKYGSSDMNVASSLLEMCDVNKTLKVIWNTDIQKENSMEIQVLKIQDVVMPSGVKDLVERLNDVFENYSMKTINRCKQKQIEGKLVVPMKWPIGSNSQKGDVGICEDFGEKLGNRLSAISLNEEE